MINHALQHDLGCFVHSVSYQSTPQRKGTRGPHALSLQRGQLITHRPHLRRHAVCCVSGLVLGLGLGLGLGLLGVGEKGGEEIFPTMFVES